MYSDAELLSLATKWAEQDPNASDRAEILGLISTHNFDELAQRFSGPLQFGTAGLRGKIRAGETGMNIAVVSRATAGLMHVLREVVDRPRVVVGCDARHGSADFQQVVAEIVSAAGGEALLLPAANPTPLTSFTVRYLNADAGVMITASHNPPDDNGYKVYLGGRVEPNDGRGVQIIAPWDSMISEAITSAPAADHIERNRDNITEVDTRPAYIARAATLGTPRPLTIALTPMHGVGGQLALKVLQAAGFPDVHLVPSQQEPDPDFPTVSFPNPEEAGALDEAEAFATTIDADLIIALDPDADRCAIAMPTSSGWRRLSGDELGALLGDFLATPGGVLANSIVSSRLLGKIAAAHGCSWTTTLTGFKWIARSPGITFGYEEAIGYCCDPEAVSDKDGISAAIVAASLASRLKAQGKTLHDRLDDLARIHGLHVTQPLTFRFDNAAQITPTLKSFMAAPPLKLGGSPVIETSDLNAGYHHLPPTPGIILLTDNDTRVVIRPSGTEPKLKCYLEVVLPVEGTDVPWDKAYQHLDSISRDIRSAVRKSM